MEFQVEVSIHCFQGALLGASLPFFEGKGGGWNMSARSNVAAVQRSCHLDRFGLAVIVFAYMLAGQPGVLEVLHLASLDR
jgi:hypothetical protein